MKITFENGIDPLSKEPEVVLSCNGEYMGTIWGTAYSDTASEFDQKYGVISIKRQDKTIIAYLWHCQPVS